MRFYFIKALVVFFFFFSNHKTKLKLFFLFHKFRENVFSFWISEKKNVNLRAHNLIFDMFASDNCVWSTSSRAGKHIQFYTGTCLELLYMCVRLLLCHALWWEHQRDEQAVCVWVKSARNKSRRSRIVVRCEVNINGISERSIAIYARELYRNRAVFVYTKKNNCTQTICTIHLRITGKLLLLSLLDMINLYMEGSTVNSIFLNSIIIKIYVNYKCLYID